ncbi:hypothetical protein CTA1_5119, partial [Colletotrichum tanaceti]
STAPEPLFCALSSLLPWLRIPVLGASQSPDRAPKNPSQLRKAIDACWDDDGDDDDGDVVLRNSTSPYCRSTRG